MSGDHQPHVELRNGHKTSRLTPERTTHKSSAELRTSLTRTFEQQSCGSSRNNCVQFIVDPSWLWDDHTNATVHQSWNKKQFCSVVVRFSAMSRKKGTCNCGQEFFRSSAIVDCWIPTRMGTQLEILNMGSIQLKVYTSLGGRQAPHGDRVNENSSFNVLKHCL